MAASCTAGRLWEIGLDRKMLDSFMVSRRAGDRKALKSRTINGRGDSGLSLLDIGACSRPPAQLADPAPNGQC